MNENELDILKEMETVEPSEQAREKAIYAAMMAFDEAAKENTSESKKSFQGILSPLRLLINGLEKTGELIMRKRILAGAMASVVVAVPVALVMFQSEVVFDKGANTISSNDAAPNTTKKDDKSKGFASGGGLSSMIKPGQKHEVTTGQQAGRKKVPVELKPQDIVVAKDKARAQRGAAVEDRADGIVRQSLSKPAPKKEIKAFAPAVVQERSRKKHSYLTASETSAPQHFGGSIGGDIEEEVDDRAEVKNRDRFSQVKDQSVVSVGEKPVSTFSIDVDTSSYSFMRRTLNGGRMPRKDSIRVEELINYFKYDYQRPETAEVPFKANVAVYPTPWNKNTKLLHIGIKGHDIVHATKPRSNLVFLIDVSGSMGQKDKLPLLKSAFKIFVNKLDKEDRVAIVVYAGRSATVLEPTRVADKGKILSALNGLNSGGSTAGAQGIQKAYALARKHFDKDGVNRVILATDGDFNVGMTGNDDLKTYIEKQRKSGIFLSILGFGQGNYNDSLMQVLAQNGNGTAAYIDSLKEAQKVLVDEASSTLFTIAKDVKIQVEFNPAQVSEYRLIGYETRALKREDFNNDKVDAGDIGSGHTVTVIYEIVPAGAPSLRFDKLRYGAKKDEAQSEGEKKSGEYAFLKMRYKLPKEDKSKLVTFPITSEHEKKEVAEVSADMRFAASVAAFGQKLRDNRFLSDYSFDDIRKLAAGSRGEDAYGYRSEFLGLVGLAKSLEKSE
ncbi:MAG: vWA domain-containing protein [Methyloligellaceae bacterium]